MKDKKFEVFLTALFPFIFLIFAMRIANKCGQNFRCFLNLLAYLSVNL